MASGWNLGAHTLNLTNGVAVGLYGSSGFVTGGAGQFYSTGRPEAMNRLCWHPALHSSS